MEMLIDPICFLINLYASFVYAIIYLYGLHIHSMSEMLTDYSTIAVYPIEFQKVRAYSKEKHGLLVLTIFLGTRLEQRRRLSSLPGHIDRSILRGHYLDLEPDILRQTPHRKRQQACARSATCLDDDWIIFLCWWSVYYRLDV